MACENATSYNAYLDKLAAVADHTISSYDDLLAALAQRHQFFHDAGCRLSDYGLEKIFAVSYSDAEVKAAFASVRAGNNLDPDQVAKLKGVTV